MTSSLAIYKTDQLFWKTCHRRCCRNLPRERQSGYTHRYFDNRLIETILLDIKFNLTEGHFTQT